MIQMVKCIMGRDKGSGEPLTTGKSPNPQPFDWNSEQLKRFLRQLGIKFALDHGNYKQDIDKIQYTSILLKGTAAKWYEVYHLQIDASAADHLQGYHVPLDPSFATWDRVEASLHSSFGSQLTHQKAVSEFQLLRHTKEIDAYIDELTRLAWQTGFSDDVTKDRIEGSLNDELSKDWSKIDMPYNYSELLMRLREMGHRNKWYAEQCGLRDEIKGK